MRIRLNLQEKIERLGAMKLSTKLIIVSIIMLPVSGELAKLATIAPSESAIETFYGTTCIVSELIGVTTLVGGLIEMTIQNGKKY